MPIPSYSAKTSNQKRAKSDVDTDSEPSPGGLLGELERRQDAVLEQLDELDAKLAEVLRGLEPAKDENDAEEAAESEPNKPSAESGEPAADWA